MRRTLLFLVLTAPASAVCGRGLMVTPAEACVLLCGFCAAIAGFTCLVALTLLRVKRSWTTYACAVLAGSLLGAVAAWGTATWTALVVGSVLGATLVLGFQSAFKD